MILGAAVGDALGWPFERRDRTSGTPDSSAPTGRFFAWDRRATRYQPFAEHIEAGAYSDDTQMTLAVARSITEAGDRWADWLQSVEWPFFLRYERGAGASVKRSCRSWAAGRPPWTTQRGDVVKYFQTGANGAAMRIAPHVIHLHREPSFASVARDVLRDAITTHGHPRALLGAVLHARSLWLSMRQPAPLTYGWIVEALLDTEDDDWRSPAWQNLPLDWVDTAERVLGRTYRELWEEVVGEVEATLKTAHDDIRVGALSNPAGFLASMGLTTKSSRGSGTLCAVGAAYLAARSAADPRTGLLIAAHLAEADTDTLASMTAGILGAGLGREWLGSYAAAVQDADLLSAMSLSLRGDVSEPLVDVPARETALPAFDRALTETAAGIIRLPDGRTATVRSRVRVHVAARSAWRSTLISDDGQSLYILHGESSTDTDRSDSFPMSEPRAGSVRLMGSQLRVCDLEYVTAVLKHVGLRPVSRGEGWARYGAVVLSQTTVIPAIGEHGSSALRLTATDSHGVRHRLELRGIPCVDSGDGMFSARVDPWLELVVAAAQDGGQTRAS